MAATSFDDEGLVEDTPTVEDFIQFLAKASATPVKKRLLKDFLQKELPYEEPRISPPEDEAEVKWDLIEDIERTWVSSQHANATQLSSWAIAAFLNMPISELQNIRQDLRLAQEICDSAETFCRLFVCGLENAQKSISRRSRATRKYSTTGAVEAASSAPVTQAGTQALKRRFSSRSETFGRATKKVLSTLTGRASSKPTRLQSSADVTSHSEGEASVSTADTCETVKRKQELRNVALSRDTVCLLSGQRQALEACHIIPFKANDTSAAVTMQKQCWDISKRLFGGLSVKLEKMLDVPGSADEAWNIITLNKCLHHLFDNGLIGLKPRGITRKGSSHEVHVQLFHFAPNVSRAKNKASGKPIREKLNDMCRLPPDPEYIEDAVATFHDYGHPIITGNVFIIQLFSQRDAKKMEAALKLRWTVGLIMSMAGAAGLSDDDLEDSDDSEDIDLSDCGQVYSEEEETFRTGSA